MLQLLIFSSAALLYSPACAGEKSGRFLSLFSVVQFRNSECVQDTRLGLCVTSSQCLETPGGTPHSSCAAGFGVCCVISLSQCGNTVDINGTYISTPTTTQSSCSYSVTAGPSICTLRLDFAEFDLHGPTDNSSPNLGGRCTTDHFNIIRTGYPAVPTLCGYNTGQHILLDLQTGDVAELSLHLDTSITYSRAWTVRVSWLECDTNMAGCFQYWTGNSGIITSFNFFNPDTSRQVHLAGLDYTICVRREVGHCCLKLSPTTTPDGWDMNGVGCSSDCNTANTCKTDGNDFILIPDANMNGRNPDQSFTRFCGNILNTFSVATGEHYVVTCAAPFHLHFHSQTSGNAGNSRGVNLEWTQLPCRHF